MFEYRRCTTASYYHTATYNYTDGGFYVLLLYYHLVCLPSPMSHQYHLSKGASDEI